MAKMFGELTQSNRGMGLVAVEQKFPDNRVNQGDEVEYHRRPRSKKVTRSLTPAIDEKPVVGTGPGSENLKVKIDKQVGGYGDEMLRGMGGAGIEYLKNNETLQAEVMRITADAVVNTSNDLLEQFMDPAGGILNDVSLAINNPNKELFQDTTDSNPNLGAPWQRNGVFSQAAKVLNYYGNADRERMMMLSEDQCSLYNGAAFSGNYDENGPGNRAARNFNSIPQDTSNFLPFKQIYTPQSTTVSTPLSFGYNSENDPATATIAATPDVRDTSISITAGANALDLKAGDVLYFTPDAAPLPNNERGRVQGYVVAVDTAIPATTTVSVPITRSVRYHPFLRDNAPDIKAGLYVRGITSHSVGLAFQRDAVALMLVDPFGTHVAAEYGGSPQPYGNVLAVAKIADKSVAEGGSGLSFWMRILVYNEGWQLDVRAWAGWHVVRPESIVRVVTPPIL
jgi:hypothetical protein